MASGSRLRRTLIGGITSQQRLGIHFIAGRIQERLDRWANSSALHLLNILAIQPIQFGRRAGAKARG